MQHTRDTLVIRGDHRARTATRSLAVATVVTGWVLMVLAALGYFLFIASIGIAAPVGPVATVFLAAGALLHHLGRGRLRPARGTDVHVDSSGVQLVGRRQQSHPWAEVARVSIDGTGPRASMVTLEPAPSARWKTAQVRLDRSRRADELRAALETVQPGITGGSRPTAAD